jgi:hypothetical protein
MIPHFCYRVTLAVLPKNFPIGLLLGGQGLSPEPIKETPAKVSYDRAKIRKLLTESLTDENLDFLCMDYFPRVFEQFSSGMSKTQKTQRLIEYCLRHIQFPHLFELVKDINPDKFTEYEDVLLIKGS